MEGQWIVSSLDRLENVLDAIAVGICGPKQKQEVAVDPKKMKKDKKDKKNQKSGEDGIALPHHSKKIGRAARYLLRCLLNRLGCVPPPRCGVSSVSSLITEVFFFHLNIIYLLFSHLPFLGRIGGKYHRKSPTKRPYPHQKTTPSLLYPPSKAHPLPLVSPFSHPLFQEQTLVTVVDHPYEDDGPKSTVIIRDATGRYCWKCNQAYLPFKERGLENRTAYHCKQPVKISR